MWLRDNIAVVTGAANGIGRASAARLADEGADLAILDIDEAGLIETAALIEKRGRRALTIGIDFRDRNAVAPAFARIRQTFGAIDVLVNNVGRSLRDQAALFADLDPETWDFMIDVCLRPTLACTHQVVGEMSRRRRGKIINIASDSVFVGSRANAPYVAAKGGVLGFTRTLARELAQFNINVNAVAPGYIKTRAMELLPKEMIEKSVAETPLGRMGEPEEIAHAVAFLASDQCSFMTGQTLVINGGRSFN